jgi:hypothetical protein
MSEFINDRRLVLGALVLGVIAVAAVIIVFFAVPEAAAHDTSQTEGDSGVSIQSLTPRASFASGTGVNLLRVGVSEHGNLSSFESPAGAEAVFNGQEGYAVCSFSSAAGDVVHGHDTGGVEAGFGPPTIVQPNPGAFPLTVIRNTTDGKFRLEQVWNRPDAVEKDITVTMTLKNRSNATITSVALSRSGNYDVGSSSADAGARTNDTALLWDDYNGIDASQGSPAVGAKMTALTFGTPHVLDVEDRFDWVDPPGTRKGCNAVSTETPAPDGGNYVMRVGYGLGDFGAGESKTVKFGIGRV